MVVAPASRMGFQYTLNLFKTATSNAVPTILGLIVTFFVPTGAFADVSIPLELVYRDGLAWGITIPLSVAGVAKKFALDTGAATTMLEADSQVEKFKILGEVPSEGVLTKRTCKVVEVPYIKAGTATVKSFPAKVCSAKSYNNLGIDAFQGHTIKLDFDHSQLDVLAESPTDLNYSVLARANDYALRVNMSFGVHAVDAIFDTGTSTTVVDSTFIKEHPETFVRVQASTAATDVGGGSTPLDIYLATNIEIGDVHIDKMYVAAMDLTSFRNDFAAKVILGNDVIFRGNWVFDLKQNRWWVKQR